MTKRLLFVGILLLIFGILIRKLTDFDGIGLLLILVGVICKTIYIIKKINTGEYKPGGELTFLFIGLFIFLIGIYLKRVDQETIDPNYLIGLGLLLKVVFIIMFIQILKKSRIIKANTLGE